jgi:GTPase SAR1 family protein
MRDRQGFILVYDITNRSSVDELQDLYLQILRNKLTNNKSPMGDTSPNSPHLSVPENEPLIPLVLVGNKLDLAIERKVPHERGKDLARQWKCPHYETSAKMRTNVDEIFYDLVSQIMEKDPKGGRKMSGSRRSSDGSSHANGSSTAMGKESVVDTEDDMVGPGCCVIA